MYAIKLADGARYAANWCGAAAGILSIQLVTDESMIILATVFSDAGKTARITFEYGEMSDNHDGYTRLIMLQDQRWNGGGVIVQLRREG